MVFISVDCTSIWHTLRRMVLLRKQYSSLAEWDFTWVYSGTSTIFAFYHSLEHERILAVHNLSDRAQDMQLYVPNPQSAWKDLYSGQVFPTTNNQLNIELTPVQFLRLI